MFKLEFETINAAFTVDPIVEIDRIIEKVQKNYRDGYTSGSILDINGNTIGKWSLTGIV